MYVDSHASLATESFHQIIAPWMYQRRDAIFEALSALDTGFNSRRRLDVPINMSLALAHHTLYLARRAMELEDAQLAQDALETWALAAGDVQKAISAYKGKPRFLLDHPYCLPANFNQPFLNDCYSIVPTTLLNGTTSLEEGYLNRAWELVEKTGLFFYIELANGIIINLKWRDMADTTDGYTLTPLPGTVFTDWTDDPLRYAEAVLHESAHTWLNFYLFSQNVDSGNNQGTWYSPWKDTQRPALGIVHGTFAFSIVYHFYDQLAKHYGYQLLPERALNYCRQRAEYELSRLKEVRDSISPALSELDSNLVTDLVLSSYPAN